MPALTVGRYEVASELGRGGMAVVYLAHDPYMKREVAVKLMSGPLVVDADFRERFQREAEVIAALEHPAIVPVYDFGYHEGQPYIVMRYMPGGSLIDHLRRAGPLPLGQAAAIMERMAAALDEAHRRGIVHRDFKPHNILLDAQGDTFLADFGLVKFVSQQGAISAAYIVGTAAYMSPEQVHGDSEIDRRADIYSMGVTLFEMLAGNPPYQDDNQTRLMMKHVLEPVPHVSQVKPDLPAGLDAVIAQAMAKDRGDRYPTAGEFSAALTAASRGIPSRRARKRWTSDELDSALGAIGDEEDDT